MANNLHISYDLRSPGQNYDALIDKIKSLGAWAKVHKSFWYVSAPYTSLQVVEILWPLMDRNDTLYVVDATTNNASWQNLDDKVRQFILNQWHA